MRTMALVIASSVLGLGCGCPTIEGLKQDRKVTGHLTYQLADASPMTGDIGTNAYLLVNSDAYGAYPGEVAFGFAPDERSSGTSAPLFFRFVVRVAPNGDSETDLSASGPDAEVFDLASGTFVANDTVYDTGMCRPDG